MPWDIRVETLRKKELPDYARRCSDEVNLHATLGNYGRFVAVRLSDGGTDGVLYDTREDAIKHQLHPEYCFYLLVPPGGMTPLEAQVCIEFKRQAFEAGWNMAGEYEPIQELKRESYALAMQRLREASNGS